VKRHNEFYRLDGGDGGNIPAKYPLQVGDICKPVNGELPENAWNAAEKNWVALIWIPCADPRVAVTP